MNLADYHIHSEFSPDSQEPIEAICRRALELNMAEIAITDHCEFPMMEKTPWPDFDKRNEEIARCRELFPDLRIICGIELGQPYYDYPLLDKLMSEQEFDFIIGSTHHRAARIDYKTIEINEDNFAELFYEYIENEKLLTDTVDFDVIGHIDYFFKYCPADIVRRHPPESFRDEFCELFEMIVKKGCGIEINCSGLRMPSVENTLPSVELLRLYKKCGGKTVTVGSDGHSLRSAFSGIAQGYENLRAAGFESVARFNKRQVEYVQI